MRMGIGFYEAERLRDDLFPEYFIYIFSSRLIARAPNNSLAYNNRARRRSFKYSSRAFCSLSLEPVPLIRSMVHAERQPTRCLHTDDVT